MVSNRWKYVGKTEYATIYIDYKSKTTKIVTNKHIYFHNGIYPSHNPDYTRRFKK
jgi:hypothetical protein